MIITTLADIQEHLPRDRWQHLLRALGAPCADGRPLAVERILEINGLDDALCALQAVRGYDSAIRLFACHCARYCLDIFERRYHPDEKRPRQAIETAERHAHGQATDKELTAVRFAAGYASDECHPYSFFGIPLPPPPTPFLPLLWLARLFPNPENDADLAMYAASNATWATCIANAADAARNATKNAMDAVKNAERVLRNDLSGEFMGELMGVKNADERAARDDFTREFFRLCRLEGAYGEVSGRERQSGETPS